MRPFLKAIIWAYSTLLYGLKESVLMGVQEWQLMMFCDYMQF